MRRQLITLIALATLMAAGCGTDDSGQGDPAPTTTGTAAPTVPSPGTSSPDGTSPDDVDDVADLAFTDCDADRYRVGYPADWNTNATDGLLEPCVLEEQETTVAGHEARAVEYRSTGEGLVPEGERSYTWTIDLDGQILVATTSSVGDTDFKRDKRILDRMITEELAITGAG